MPKPTRPCYRTTNWSAYNASLRKRGSLSVWFDPDMVWHAEKSGKRGRPDTFSDAAIQTCLTLKVLFGLPLRQTAGLVESLIRMAGLDWPVPDYSTLCRRPARIAVQIPYRLCQVIDAPRMHALPSVMISKVSQPRLKGFRFGAVA